MLVFTDDLAVYMTCVFLSQSGDDQSSGSECDEWKDYSGEVCSDELMKWQLCFTPQDNVIRIPSDTSQEEAENAAKGLLQGLPLLSPSPECEAAIKPFLCLYLFGSCDTNNQPHQALQADCVRLRDDVCAQEWTLVERLLGQGILPDCSALLNQEDECQSMKDLPAILLVTVMFSKTLFYYKGRGIPFLPKFINCMQDIMT